MTKQAIIVMTGSLGVKPSMGLGVKVFRVSKVLTANFYVEAKTE